MLGHVIPKQVCSDGVMMSSSASLPSNRGILFLLAIRINYGT